MKDYSLTVKKRKDFVLGYDITKDGMIIVKFAVGEPIILPYNERNEEILLNKMEEQVVEASKFEEKYLNKRSKFIKLFKLMLSSILISTIMILASQIAFIDSIFALIFSFSAIYGVVFLTNVVNIDGMLEDMKKNKRFLELKDKINKNIKCDQNILVNVSGYTKKFIKENSNVDRPLFDINSFNYVPYEDLEQISENIERNERFGFDYTGQEKPVRGVVRKKTR